MNETEIRPGQCYRLINGHIVRVISINEGIARCDTYRPAEKKWVQTYAPIPSSVFKEPCSDPKTGANEE